ncbi:MAG: hypothetical protein ACKPEO_06405 [Sphaerospermopsis kisseleviana]
MGNIIPSHQSPVPSPQSPVTSPQSPVPNQKIEFSEDLKLKILCQKYTNQLPNITTSVLNTTRRH